VLPACLQAQAHLPATPLMLEASASQLAQQQQQQQQENAELGSAHDLPAVLKSSSTQVDMSLVLKAARDVPLHLLSAEYEKVRGQDAAGNRVVAAAGNNTVQTNSTAARQVWTLPSATPYMLSGFDLFSSVACFALVQLLFTGPAQALGPGGWQRRGHHSAAAAAGQLQRRPAAACSRHSRQQQQQQQQ
jgi:hypothetical protein